ncbi:50S ribosomal protein L15 [Candidatus Omnitrophota bacterium]
MQLHDIKPLIKFKKAKRVGRGSGSGHGKTSTRGHKGAKSRSGRLTYAGYEGGSLPYLRKIPKRGFNHKNRVVFEIVNIRDLEARFKEKDRVTPEELFNRNLIKNKESLVKILGKGVIKKPLTVCAHRFSEKAQQSIEKAEGKIEPIAVAK